MEKNIIAAEQQEKALHEIQNIFQTWLGYLPSVFHGHTVAHYSMLNGSDQLYAAKYLTYMPTKEELRREIEQQKEFFRLQNSK